MTKMDLVIKNGRVYAGGCFQNVDLWIKDDKIAKIGGSSRADEVLDARGLMVLPGAVDIHVHFRDPGYTYKEDWKTGSTSAAAGGVTTVVDQPNTDPPTLDARSYRMKLDKAKRRSVVDFCLNGGPGKIEELAKQGAMAIGEIFTYEHTESELRKILEKVKEAGLLPTIHAEDRSVIQESTKLLKGQLDPGIYSQSRPNRAEAAAIEKVLEMTDKVHICHLSTKEGLDLIKSSKSSGKNVSCEVTPHHLFFTKRDWRKQGTFLKTNPPVRDPRDKNALWEGLRIGEIDVVASDHAPHLPEEKKEEIWYAPPGVPGVETMLPLMLSAVKSNLITLDRMVNALSKMPATILGLKSKGEIALGKDADLVLINTRKAIEIRANNLHSGAEWTPYQGRYALFPKITMIRGEIVFQEGELVAKPGYGRYIPGPRISK
ncbi:MAG: dihydroorotase [Methanotrichaceae archaeon]